MFRRPTPRDTSSIRVKSRQIIQSLSNEVYYRTVDSQENLKANVRPDNICWERLNKVLER